MTAAISYLVCFIHVTRIAVLIYLFVLGGVFTVSLARLQGLRFIYDLFFSVQASELVANLFQECDTNKGDYHGLCK